MAEALYGENGFYTSAGAPRRNFRTSAHASPLWATAIWTLARRVDEALGSPESFTVVDVGAGGGELLNALSALVPRTWSLVGVDLAPRPEGLDPGVRWSDITPDGIDGLIIANELLDVVPVDVVERIDGMPRQVEVTPAGEEEIAGLVTGRDAQWLSTWWPLMEDGDRAEIGWARDDLWRELTGRLRRGVAAAIDYAADPAHDLAGTMTGYRDGRQVDPVPDGSCDITAHVVFNSLVEADDVVMSQRDALLTLGLTASPPSYDGDPTSYLSELAASGEAAELLDPDGLGGFTWLLHGVDISPVKIMGV